MQVLQNLPRTIPDPTGKGVQKQQVKREAKWQCMLPALQVATHK